MNIFFPFPHTRRNSLRDEDKATEEDKKIQFLFDMYDLDCDGYQFCRNIIGSISRSISALPLAVSVTLIPVLFDYAK